MNQATGIRKIKTSPLSLLGAHDELRQLRDLHHETTKDLGTLVLSFQTLLGSAEVGSPPTAGELAEHARKLRLLSLDLEAFGMHIETLAKVASS